MESDELRAGLLALPPNERAELAHVLLESLHDEEPDPGAEAAWLSELDRRAQAVADGNGRARRLGRRSNSHRLSPEGSS